MMTLGLTVLTELLADTNDETIRFIYENARIERYPEETTLCRSGAVEDTFYVLLEGQADVYKFQDGETILLDYLRPGQVFGELALIMDVPRTADVVTSEPVTVLEIRREDFNQYIINNPSALLAVVRLIIQRILRQQERHLIELARKMKAGSAAPEVFISYARKDEPMARRLASDLKKNKINTWVDVHEIDAGQSWARQIGKALDICRLMVLILTPASIASENVEDEWNYYLDKNKPIIPVLIQGCDLPYRLHKLQYIDFAGTSYDSALTQLITNINFHIV